MHRNDTQTARRCKTRVTRQTFPVLLTRKIPLGWSSQERLLREEQLWSFNALVRDPTKIRGEQ
jgi:hypothetical protein